MADHLNMELEYSWEPFTFQGKHLTFHEHHHSRLSSTACSHWGPAVYKWEGLLTNGEHMGKTGVLIGQCDDLRQRIKQYVSGTQELGNKYWREQFLNKGSIYLYTLNIIKGGVHDALGKLLSITTESLASENIRLVLEQLLVSREVARKSGKRWIVNRAL